MIVIDLPADLHMEDDEGRGMARVPGQATVAPGDVLVAGAPDFWSWAIVEEIAGGFVHFRQITQAQAATLTQLAVSAYPQATSGTSRLEADQPPAHTQPPPELPPPAPGTYSDEGQPPTWGHLHDAAGRIAESGDDDDLNLDA